MAYFTATLLLVSSLTSALQAQQEIRAKPGDDVLLHCQISRGETITLLHWTRPDLKSDGYIFFFRGKRLIESYLHPSVRGRVQLKDGSSMEDGDLSVILKNVTINDSGTYECHVTVRDKESELRNITTLKVEDSGYEAEGEGEEDQGKQDGGKEERNHIIMSAVFSSLVVLLLLFCLVGCVVFKCYRKHEKNQYYLSPTVRDGQST